MAKSPFPSLQRLGDRIQAFEQSLFRKDIVLPFMLARVVLIVVMLSVFSLAFAVVN
jgi:hypothetical protein